MQRVPLDKDRIRNFDEVISAAKDLGYKVAVTGGVYLTHEIHCTIDEYTAIYELANGIVTLP